MNEIIKITEKEGKRVVSARDLHEFLEVGRDFSTWCKQMIDYGFVEGVDFSPILVKSLLPENGEQVQRGGSNKIEYALTIETAKHWAMMQRSEKGMDIRNYFIECEKELSKPTSTAKIDMTMAFYKGAADILGMNDSSKLLMMQNIAKELDLPLSGLPAYTKSVDQLLSGTELLKRNESEWSIRTFNSIMMDKDMLEEKERLSKSGAKKFKSLIGEGLDFGENQVCPNNPRETQPLYYTDKFDKLLTILKR